MKSDVSLFVEENYFPSETETHNFSGNTLTIALHITLKQ